MSGFKMQSHPVYRNGYVDGFAQLIPLDPMERTNILNDVFTKEVLTASINKEALEGMGEDFMKIRFYSELEQKLHIIDSGHQLVKISSDDWDETVSEKTIGKMLGSDVQLPYDAFAIDVSGAAWAMHYDTAFISRYNGQLVIRLETNKDDWYMILLALNIPIADTLANTVSLPQSENITFKIISIIMYMTLFKREPNRVDIRTVKSRNTQGVPKYRISQTRLIQPEYAMLGKTRDAAACFHLQLHLRRGHWRSQPFGKREEKKTRPTFIKPQWVGKGRDKMSTASRETII